MEGIKVRGRYVWTCFLDGVRELGASVQRNSLVGILTLFAFLGGPTIAVTVGWVPAYLSWPTATIVIAVVILEGAYHRDRTAEILQDERAAIQALTPLIEAGNRILGQHGRPNAPGYPPMLFVERGLPAIGAWSSEVTQAIRDHAPDYMATWQNDGNVYDNHEQKAVAIQQLQGRLQRLESIIAELRRRL